MGREVNEVSFTRDALYIAGEVFSLAPRPR